MFTVRNVTASMIYDIYCTMIDFQIDFNVLKVLVLYMTKIKINRFDYPCLSEKKNKIKYRMRSFLMFVFGQYSMV